MKIKALLKKKNIITIIAIAMILLMYLVGCSEAAKEILSVEEASHAKIGAMIGSTGEQIAFERYPEADIKSFEDTMDAISALLSGQIDAVVTAVSNAIHTVKHNPQLYYLDEPLAVEKTAMAVKKGNTELLEEVNSIIEELKDEGKLEAMKKNWFRTDLSPYDPFDRTASATGQVLRVGVSATREPFSFIDAQHQISGHDGELAYIIARKLERPIEFVDMRFSALIPALQSGKIDIIITGMSFTEERGQSVDFTEPYFDNLQVLLVKKNQQGASQDLFKELDDIHDQRVGVYEGTIHDAFVQENYPDAVIYRYASTTDMVLALKTDKVDAVFLDGSSGNVVLSKHSELGFLTDDVLPMDLGIGFHKKRSDLLQQFNLFLKELKEEGTYQEMVERWIVNDPELAEMPSLDMDAQDPKIIIGVSVADLPYIAYQDGKYIGFDIELIKRFAHREGFYPEFLTMDFAALVAAASSGKVDMIADGIAITEERMQKIDFSDSYLEHKTAVLVLNSRLEDAAQQELSRKHTNFFQGVADSFYNNLILENRYILILEGLRTTIVIALLATVFGTILGGLVCFLRMSKIRFLSALAKVYISILRGTPVLVFLMIIFYVIFASVNISPILVAVIAFGMNFAAYVSEMYRTGIESIDKGQTEAGIAMGFTKTKSFFYIIMPQAIRRILPVYKGEFVSLIKMTSIVGYIAVQDLTKASDIIRSRTFDAFFPLIMVAILYFAVSWFFIFILERVEIQADPKRRMGKAGKSI